MVSLEPNPEKTLMLYVAGYGMVAWHRTAPNMSRVDLAPSQTLRVLPGLGQQMSGVFPWRIHLPTVVLSLVLVHQSRTKPPGQLYTVVQISGKVLRNISPHHWSQQTNSVESHDQPSGNGKREGAWPVMLSRHRTLNSFAAVQGCDKG